MQISRYLLSYDQRKIYIFLLFYTWHVYRYTYLYIHSFSFILIHLQRRTPMFRKRISSIHYRTITNECSRIRVREYIIKAGVERKEKDVSFLRFLPLSALAEIKEKRFCVTASFLIRRSVICQTFFLFLFILSSSLSFSFSFAFFTLSVRLFYFHSFDRYPITQFKSFTYFKDKRALFRCKNKIKWVFFFKIRSHKLCNEIISFLWRKVYYDLNYDLFFLRFPFSKRIDNIAFMIDKQRNDNSIENINNSFYLKSEKQYRFPLKSYTNV